MSETLTYNSDIQTETVSENLTPDEQDSLQVGEQIQQQEEQLLAGKYKSAEELEKAYVSLQEKLGSNSEPSENIKSKETAEDDEDDDDEDDSPEDTIKSDDDSDYSFLEKVWEEANTQYTQDTTNKLADMKVSDIVNMHLAYRSDVQKNFVQPRTLNESEITDLKAVAGGEKEYNSMIDWAGENLTKEEVSMFDQVMERGDPLSCFFAVRALSYRYEDSVGRTGKMVTGTAPKENVNSFRSQAELVAAMSDKRYDNDPAYRQDVMKKLEQSPNLKF